MGVMPMPLSDLTGRKFGRLTVIERAANGSKGARWRCVCECSGEKIVTASNLQYGGVRSCGCWRRERSKDNRTHGESGSGNTARSKEYAAWIAQRNRCRNPRDKNFKNYGGRGIKEWTDGYPAFLAHIGRAPSPKHTLDRIDNDRGYEPGNLRWSTVKEQNANRRRRQ